MTQTLLFPDPRPLVERLGAAFFRSVPERPGVYLMRDARDTVLYVGKAKNLRQRLRSYRVANPDRMPPRHLRLLRAVARIELQECADESSALACEARWLSSLKPRYNRVGVWPRPPSFLLWRCLGENMEMTVAGAPRPGWNACGPLAAGALRLRHALLRLLWFTRPPPSRLNAMPAGWVRGAFGENASINCGARGPLVAANLEKLFAGQLIAFIDWVRATVPADLHPFEKAVLEAGVESLSHFFKTVPPA